MQGAGPQTVGSTKKERTEAYLYHWGKAAGWEFLLLPAVYKLLVKIIHRETVIQIRDGFWSWWPLEVPLQHPRRGGGQLRDFQCPYKPCIWKTTPSVDLATVPTVISVILAFLQTTCPWTSGWLPEHKSHQGASAWASTDMKTEYNDSTAAISFY